jgi:putative ABC transport system permease protein
MMPRIAGLRRYFRLPWRDAARIRDDVDDELRFHLEMRAEELVGGGMTPDAARAEARRQFGDMEYTRHYCRRADESQATVERRAELLGELAHDTRFALRQLRRSPTFTLVAVLTLAVGIGASTAMFTVVNATWLRWLGTYREPERLVMVFQSKDTELWAPTPADYRDWRAQQRSFEQLGAYYYESASLTADREPERLAGAHISASLFPLLGVRPAVGRTFAEAEESWGNHRVALISYGLWQRRFGGDPKIVGRAVTLDGVPHTVVGAMPPGAWFGSTRSDIWLPLAFAPNDPSNDRRSHFLTVVARLRGDVSAERASADMSAIAARLAREYPENAGVGARMRTLRESVLGRIEPMLLVLSGAVAFVLLIACANMANLRLGRAAAREREIGIRTALGASRSRLVRQVLTESAVLGLLGGSLGLAIAFVGLRAASGTLPARLPRVYETGLAMDGRVLAFALALSFLTAVLFGLAPALQTSQASPTDSLREGSRGYAGTFRGQRLRGILVVIEVALAVVLLCGAGLLARSFVRLQQVDLGFRTENVLAMRVELPAARTQSADTVSAFYERVLRAMATIPGVRHAGVTSHLPLSGGGDAKFFAVDGRPYPKSLAEVPTVFARHESAHALEAMGIPLIAGRYFSETDARDSPRVVVVGESVARRFFAGEDPIGRTILLDAPEPLWPADAFPPGVRRFARWTIVGIVKDTRYQSVRDAPELVVHVPYVQRPSYWGGAPAYLVIHTFAKPLSLIGAVRQQVWAVDKGQPVADVRTMAQVVDESLRESRFSMVLLGIFAAIALLLGAVGIYGVISYVVSLQTHAIGVRLALGALPQEVLWLVVRRGARLALAGVAVGVAVALAVTRLLATMLYGVEATDPATLITVTFVVTMVALLATLIPGRRASRIDPLEALRG